MATKFDSTENLNGGSNGSDTSNSVPHTEQQQTHHNNTSPLPTGFSAQWTAGINGLEQNFTSVLRKIARHAASNPKSHIVTIIVLSLGILAAGYMTNFNVDVNDDTLWTPAGSKPVVHMQWIQGELPPAPRPLVLFFHANGNNVISQEGIDHVFEAVDMVRQLDGYDTVCAQSTHKEDDGNTCAVRGVTSFWNNSRTIYEESVDSHEDLIATVSADTDGKGRPVDFEGIVGYPTFEDNGVTVASGKSYLIHFQLPETDGAMELEEVFVETLLDLQMKWAAAGSMFHVEIQAERSFDDEFYRGIVKDIPLVPLVFVVMSIFTCAIFFKRDPIQSRCWMGFGAVVAVLLAILTGYGILFCIGVPFTSMTQILPFVMFGIGLDDAFIITGAYGRTDPKKDTVDRIDETIEAVGLSIALTTITSVLAFGLGGISSIPAVYWLCYYAFPTLAINFLYQITFFVAIIAIDERRIQDKRRDCCFCLSGPSKEEEEVAALTVEVQESMADRAMLRYADFLLRPWVKAAVLLVFTLMLAGFSYSASLLEQEFKVVDVLPSDSYLVDFFRSWESYYSKATVFPMAYFRFVNQSDPEIQDQMIDYVNEMAEIDGISEPPKFFWLNHFRELQANYSEHLVNMTFNQQMDLFLQVPAMQELYGNDIMRDENGDITCSRVYLFIDNVDIDNVKNQISIMEDQQAVTAAQPINQGQKHWRFFNFDAVYNIWEFYTVAVDELILTTIIGVVAVTGVALAMVPHWTAAFFVLPLICILYIDLLGFLQMCGAHINAVSYMALVMSIGLMVDFIIHILLRFYECEGNRNEKVRETLRTMGSSIMIGAFSTFLGIIPLGFSSSVIFKIIFYAFVGLVILGALHGLVLLPVVLSIIGPEDCIRQTMNSPPTVPEPDAKDAPQKDLVSPPINTSLEPGIEEVEDTV